MGVQQLLNPIMEAAMATLFLFGRWMVLMTVILFAVYVYFRRQSRNGNLRSYNSP